MNPSTPAKEYICLNGQIVAIENAVPPPSSQATLSTADLNFGNQILGATSAPQSITLTNTGNAALVVSSIQITGSNPGDFSETNNCSSVAPNASCAITVTFTPAAAGARTASVSIADDAANSPQTVSLGGTGVYASGALQFIPVTPCRVVDTRAANGPFGGPELEAGSTRDFAIPSGACGIPSSAAAYSLNATVIPDSTARLPG